LVQCPTLAACNIIPRSIVIVHSLQLCQLMGVIETTVAAEMARKLTLLDLLHMQKESVESGYSLLVTGSSPSRNSHACISL